MDIQEKLAIARKERLSNDGGLATADPEQVSIAQFNSGAIALQRNDPLLFAAMQQALVKKLFETQMIKGVHYGLIPGCGNTPAMMKAGAELLTRQLNIYHNDSCCQPVIQ